MRQSCMHPVLVCWRLHFGMLTFPRAFSGGIGFRTRYASFRLNHLVCTKFSLNLPKVTRSNTYLVVVLSQQSGCSPEGVTFRNAGGRELQRYGSTFGQIPRVEKLAKPTKCTFAPTVVELLF